jgi:hypothetical protein
LYIFVELVNINTGEGQRGVILEDRTDFRVWS